MRSILLCAACFAAAAQNHPGANFDEAQVPPYTLPDPLVMIGGEHVHDAKTWTGRRRPQILEMYRMQMFGRSPAAPARLDYEVVSVDKSALGGKAVRKLVTIRIGSHPIPVLLYLAAGAKKP